jgi:hypothetical protein
MKKISLLLLLNLIIISSFGNNKINFLPEPTWVTHKDYQYKTGYEELRSYTTLLIEKQYLLEKSHYYFKSKIRVNSYKGIDNQSGISISWDPAFEKLIIHSSTITRQGKIISELNLNDFEVLQQEKNISRKLYNGNLTAFAKLKGVRKGDIIEYAYSIIGKNPILENHYVGRYYLEVSTPTENLYFNFIHGNTAINHKIICDRIHHSHIVNETAKRIEIHEQDIKAILLEDKLPSSFSPYAYIQLSRFKTWKDLNDLFFLLYENKLADNIALNEVANLVKGDTLGNTVKCIRFVQDEIRYFGFEAGIQGWIPKPTSDVLIDRFGDCKEKSLLLVNLLRTMGVKSNPTLVNSSTKNQNKTKYLPSPYIFNHCIVQINWHGKKIYVDPTIENQGGELAKIFIPNYGLGLALFKGNNALDTVLLNEQSESKTEIIEQFKVPNFDIDLTKNIVKTKYKGTNADSQRAYYLSKTYQEIKTDYVDF